MSLRRLRVDWVSVLLVIAAALSIAAVLWPERTTAAEADVIEIIDADDLTRVLLRCHGPVPLALELGTSPLAMVCSGAEVVPPPVPPLFRDGFEP